MPVTSPARTVVDLAREHGVAAAVVAGDHALRKALTTRAELDRTAAECRRWPGIATARSALDLLDGRSESPLESLSRLRLQAHQLPRPDLQADLRDERGRFVARVDFLFEGRVIGEADGLSKYDTIAVLHAEKIRHERLENLGYVVVRWMWRDLGCFGAVAERIRGALARPGRRPGVALCAPNRR